MDVVDIANSHFTIFQALAGQMGWNSINQNAIPPWNISFNFSLRVINCLRSGIFTVWMKYSLIQTIKIFSHFIKI